MGRLRDQMVIRWCQKIPDLVTCLTLDLSHRRDLPPQPSSYPLNNIRMYITLSQASARCADRILTEMKTPVSLAPRSANPAKETRLSGVWKGKELWDDLVSGH